MSKTPRLAKEKPMPSPLTDQQLDDLDALCADTTPGPWSHTDSGAIVAPLTQQHIADVWEPTAASRNGEFIEAARDAVPALVAEVRCLRARTLTESEYNAAWHAVEGAAGEEGADPGTVLHAVLDRLGINLPPAPPVHGCPLDGSGVTPCCGRTPFELPRTDRMATDSTPVTCPGAAPVSA